MPTSLHHPGARLGRVLELIAITGMALLVVHIVLVLTGPNVSGLRQFGVNVTGADRAMSVRGELVAPVDFGGRLSTIDTESGTRDAATGLPPVELGGPVEAELSFGDPTRSQRASWAVGELIGPTLTLIGLWIVVRLVRSTRSGDPFTAENERRLWALAALVAIGGTVHGLVTSFVDMLLIQRSAAADLVEATARVSVLPAVLGLLVAMLAVIWGIGIRMREDLEGTI